MPITPDRWVLTQIWKMSAKVPWALHPASHTTGPVCRLHELHSADGNRFPPYFHRTGSSAAPPFGKESRPISHLGVDMSSSLLLQSSTIYLCVELECQEVVHILAVTRLPTSHLYHLCTLTPRSQKVWKTNNKQQSYSKLV